MASSNAGTFFYYLFLGALFFMYRVLCVVDNFLCGVFTFFWVYR